MEAVRTQPPLCELTGRRAGELALDDGTAQRTWGELEDRTRAIAYGLTDLVPGTGSHVALVAGNRVEFVELALGCLRAGLIYTPLKQLDARRDRHRPVGRVHLSGRHRHRRSATGRPRCRPPHPRPGPGV